MGKLKEKEDSDQRSCCKNCGVIFQQLLFICMIMLENYNQNAVYAAKMNAGHFCPKNKKHSNNAVVS